MHVCFILDNSLPMLQKTIHSQLTLFDRLKNSIESICKSLLEGIYPKFNPNRDLIHLFTTSSTEPISTHQNCTQRHLLHQIKNLQTNILTFPAQVIESALYHIGKYRTLNQSETLLGYRDGIIFEPTLIFYITTTVSKRHMQRLWDKFHAGKIHLRAQYKWVTVRYCASSPQQGIATTQTLSTTMYEKSKVVIEKDHSTSILRKLTKQMNGLLYCVYQDDEFMNIIESSINKLTPTLNISLLIKQYKIHHKQLIKVRLPSSCSEEQYLTRIISKTTVDLSSCLLNQRQKSTDNFTINAIPNPRQLIIPLPQDVTSKQIQDDKIVIDQLHGLKFCIDFGKQYVGETDPTMKVLFNTYQILDHKKLNFIVKDMANMGDKKFPAFYQKKKTQYIIGYIKLYWQYSQNKIPRPYFQLHISFSNFINLNSTIRSYRERHPSYQQFFQNYISTLPIFYHKFLHFYLPKLNIKLSPQTEQLFINIQNTPQGIMNWKIYEQTLKLKKLSTMEQKKNYEDHEKNTSTCCSVYSENFNQWQISRSKGDDDTQASNSTLEQQFFIDNFKKLRKIKQILGVNDYLLVKNEQSRPMRKQLEKYSVRRDDDEMDELMGDLLGNPFKKLNKKVKINDQAESVWMDVEDLKQMRSLLQKQKQILQSVKQVSQGDQVESSQFIERNNIYDKAAWIKQKIVNTLKKNLDQQTVEEKSIGKQQQRVCQQQERNILQNQTTIDKQVKKDELPLTDNLIHDQQPLGQNQNLLTNEKTDYVPQLIKSINSKFKTNKSIKVKVPSRLICCDDFDRNKKIIDEVIRAKDKLK